MITPVSYATLLDAPNIKALLREYAEECSIPELGYASPQRDLYELLEKSGGFQAFGVYDGDFLVGFACVLVYVLPHYGQKVAATESIFISKPHRAMGFQLMGYLEEYAREKDCLAFLYSAPVGSRFDMMMAGFQGYRHTSSVYLRPL